MPAPNHPQLKNLFNNTFLYGSSYYPEHWEKKIRDSDPALFASADWNVVRMGEFAWDRFEPEEGKYDFSLFDETIDAFWRHGIRAILCTPTAAPPIWLSQKHPEILRGSNPSWFVTHNGVFDHIDFRGAFSKDLDFLSYDLYPFFEHDPRRRAGLAAFNLDWTRAYAGNFVIMEHQAGPGGQMDYFHDNPEPGELREMVWTSVAHGAEGILLFRERSCRFGAEEFWCGVLDHDNVPRRRFREAARIGAELKAVGSEIVGSKVRVDIGIAGADFTNDEGHLPLSLGLPKPKSVARTIHRHFYDRGYAVGVVHPEDELNDLKLFFLPHLAHFDPGWGAPLARFVERGGWLVIGARTGTKDLNNNVVPHTFPGHLSELTGVSVEEYGRQNAPAARPLRIRIADREVDSELWYESLKLSGSAQPLATWTTRHLADEVAISVKPLGKGAVLYVGTYFTDTLLEALVPHLLTILMPHPPERLSTKEGIEIVERCGNDKRYRFIINHRDESTEIAWPADVQASLLGHEPRNGKLILKAHDAALFTQAFHKTGHVAHELHKSARMKNP